MRAITLQPDDFAALRQSLPPLSFQPGGDTTAAEPLLLRHLFDYRFPWRDSPRVQFRVGAFHSGGDRICGYYWLPEEPRGTSFLVHGYFDHIGLYGHLVEHLIGRGQAVVTFDLPGHGLSAGEPLAIDHFGDYQRVFDDLLQRCGHFPRPFNALGQSTGGAIVLGLLQARCRLGADNPFQQIYLLAPLIRPWRWRYKKLLYRILNPFVATARREYRRNSNDRAFVRFLESGEPLQQHRIPLCWVAAMMQWAEDFAGAPVCHWPIAVIQGDRDTTVDGPHNLRRIAEQFPAARLHRLPGAMHHLVNEREDIRARVFAFLTF